MHSSLALQIAKFTANISAHVISDCLTRDTTNTAPCMPSTLTGVPNVIKVVIPHTTFAQ